MRRMFADRLALVTGLIVIFISILFALWRTGGAGTHNLLRLHQTGSVILAIVSASRRGAL